MKTTDIKRKAFLNKALITMLILTLVGVLYAKPRWKKWFPPNPYKLNYTKISGLSNIIDTGVSPKGETTFFVTLGSRTCPACTQLYKTMAKYNQQGLNKSEAEGFIPYWTTDIDLEYEAGIEFAYDYLMDSEYVTWKGENGVFATSNDIATPATFFIKNGKLQEIILGSALKVEQITSYVIENK